MAAIPKNLTEQPPRSSADGRGALSHGRGGAGNIGSTPSDLEPPSLDTPTLKSEVYTTGRGGSGNMAKNLDAEAARRAQDVVANPRRPSNNEVHVGRGGAANVFRPSAEELAGAKSDQKWESAVSDDADVALTNDKARGGEKEDHRGLADKGKDYLDGLFGRKKK